MIARNKDNIQEFFRFLICGAIATIVDFVIFGLVIYLISPLSYDYNIINSLTADRSIVPVNSVLWATALGFTSGLIVNYLISISYVYNHTDRAKTYRGAIIFAIISITGLILNILLMKIAYDIIGINHWLSKLIVTSTIFIYNYLSKRLIIFRPNGIN